MFEIMSADILTNFTCAEICVPVPLSVCCPLSPDSVHLTHLMPEGVNLPPVCPLVLLYLPFQIVNFFLESLSGVFSFRNFLPIFLNSLSCSSDSCVMRLFISAGGGSWGGDGNTQGHRSGSVVVVVG